MAFKFNPISMLGNLRTGSTRTTAGGVTSNPAGSRPPVVAAPATSIGEAATMQPTAFDPIDPFELVQYGNQANSLRRTYGQSSARNTYNRTQLDLRHQMAQDDLSQQFFDFRQQIPGNYVSRGLINSGLYKHALEQYSQQKLKSQNKLQFEYGQQLGDLDLQRLDIEENLSGGLSAIDAEKQARRAQLAAQLRELA